MTSIVYISKDNLLAGRHEQVWTDLSIADWIVDRYLGSSIAYSVFKGQPCHDNDITLAILNGEYDGHGDYIVTETPSAGIGFAGWVAIISIVISVASIAMAKKARLPDNVRREQESPNNALGSRSNRARPLQRIPDIKGTVKSIPDIIMPTYFRYRDLRTRAEYGYYCVGRKELSIADINDGDTPISLVEGASAQVYGPYKSPNNSAPDIQIGEPINQRVVTPYRSNEVDGVDLPGTYEVGATPLIRTTATVPTPSGDTGMSVGNESATVFYINVERPGIPDWLSPDYYVGNYVILENFIVTNDPAGTPSENDWSGEYEISDVIQVLSDTYTVKLLKGDFVWPPGVNVPNVGSSMRTKFSTPYNEWVYMTRDSFDRGHINIVANNGLYRDKGTGSIKTVQIEIEVEVEPVDSSGLPAGSSEVISAQISGNSQTKRGLTVDFSLPYRTPFRCRVRRLTGEITGTGTIMDDIKWEDLYGIKDVDESHFGNITTIQTVTVSTPFATAIKERQLNCIATERLYPYLGSGVFSEDIADNSSAIQSYITDFIDPVIGGRPIDEIDADGLLDLENDIDAYFGNSYHSQFNYTLDSTDITFQDYTQMLFDAINCIAYRDGSQVKAHFEKIGGTPSMLFTHRSKIPGSETYSRNFNFSSLNDGVEFTWVDPETNTQEVIYLPADKTATNPKKFEKPGFRNYEQAYRRAWREYNKILNEKIVVDVEVTADGQYVKPGSIISIVKGTRTNTTDGEVIGVSLDGYTLTLAQDVEFTPGDTHSIILKRDDGSTEAITCTAGPESNQVILANLPTAEIRTGIDYQRRTEFSFGNDARHDAQLFIARSIDAANKHTVQLKAVNYTDAYYANDNESLNAFDSGFSDGFS